MKKDVYEANIMLPKLDLVTFTWGNVSEIDRELEVIVIKPSGVEYDDMKKEDMVVTDLEGVVIEGSLKPSSDLATHVELYKAFPDIKAVVHTHSTHATAYAQAKVPIACLGTTHADTFYGTVPCTQLLSDEEILNDYEKNTGLLITRTFIDNNIDPNSIPGVLVASHGPFVWGKNAKDAVYNAKVLEEVAKINILSNTINPTQSVSNTLLDKHYLRKHGKGAYYGQ